MIVLVVVVVVVVVDMVNLSTADIEIGLPCLQLAVSQDLRFHYNNTDNNDNDTIMNC